MLPIQLKQLRDNVAHKHGAKDLEDMATSLFHFHPDANPVVNFQILSAMMDSCIEIGYTLGKKEAEEKFYNEDES